MSRGTCALTRLDSDYIWPDEPNSVTEFKVIFFGGGILKKWFCCLESSGLWKQQTWGQRPAKRYERDFLHHMCVFTWDFFFLNGNTWRCHLLSSRATQANVGFNASSKFHGERSTDVWASFPSPFSLPPHRTFPLFISFPFFPPFFDAGTQGSEKAW